MQALDSQPSQVFQGRGCSLDSSAQDEKLPFFSLHARMHLPVSSRFHVLICLPEVLPVWKAQPQAKHHQATSCNVWSEQRYLSAPRL